jgi:DNA polymerase elongation subunit (family B)
MKFYTNVYSYGSKILVRYNENGVKRKDELSFRPSLFVSTDKSSKYKSIHGVNLSKVDFENMHEYRQFIERYADVKGFEIHGEIASEYQYIRENYGDNLNYDFSLIDVMFIDIETTCDSGFPQIDDPNEKVIAITAKRAGKTPVVFCLGNFKPTNKEDVRIFSDEEMLLAEFVEWFSKDYPDVITGWNIRFFDIPYLYNRIVKLFGQKYAKKLSPWHVIRDKMVIRKGQNVESKVYDLIGISTMDYYELYKTFTYVNQESYSLNHISQVELGEGKMSYGEYETIQDFYTKNFQKFIEYNIKDVVLVERLEEKLKLMELALALAYSAGVNYTDVFSQVKTWDVIIYNYLAHNNVVIPPKKKSSKDEQYAGAYVKEPLVGMFDWVVSYDLNSLYPHLIMQYNISPETATNDGHRGIVSVDGILNRGTVSMKYLEEMKEKNVSVAANGTTYRKDIRGFLPELMDKMYKDRKMYKNKMIDAKKDLESVVAEMKRRGLS